LFSSSSKACSLGLLSSYGGVYIPGKEAASPGASTWTVAPPSTPSSYQYSIGILISSSSLTWSQIAPLQTRPLWTCSASANVAMSSQIYLCYTCTLPSKSRHLPFSFLQQKDKQADDRHISTFLLTPFPFLSSLSSRHTTILPSDQEHWLTKYLNIRRNPYTTPLRRKRRGE
jgi:hypothetical protein